MRYTMLQHPPPHVMQGWPECHAHAAHFLEFWHDAFPTEPRHYSGHHRKPRLGVHAPSAHWPRGAWGHASRRLGGVVTARMLLRLLLLYLLVVNYPPSHALQGWPECHAHAAHFLEFWRDFFPTEPRHCSGHHRKPTPRGP